MEQVNDGVSVEEEGRLTKNETNDLRRSQGLLALCKSSFFQPSASLWWYGGNVVNESGYYNQVNHQTSLHGDKGVLGRR